MFKLRTGHSPCDNSPPASPASNLQEEKRGESRAIRLFLKAQTETCRYHFSLYCIGKRSVAWPNRAAVKAGQCSLAGQCVFSWSLGCYFQGKEGKKDGEKLVVSAVDDNLHHVT